MNKTQDTLFQVVYGSKLYGTSTPTSDTDLKTVYLPPIDEMLLGKKLVAFKTRVDENGINVPDSSPMPERGTENEYISFQTFVRDFVAGQTYAVEIAFAILNNGPQAPDPASRREFELVQEMVQRFSNTEVYSMVSFAKKQTFDYVKRGERLKEAQKVLDIVNEIQSVLGATNLDVRLDLSIAFMRDGVLVQTSVLDEVAKRTGLPLGTTVNNNRTLRTLELNGRSYTESTELSHLKKMVQKFVDQYGERSTAASKTDVDFKSLSHAVRVYQQAIEILDTGKVTFPRANAAELLRVKQGLADLEEVKALLQSLDEEVLRKMETSTQRKKTPELVAEAELWLVKTLRELYLIDLNCGL